MRPRSAWVPYAGHAVASLEGGELYRQMYAALAPRWVAAGCFTHYIELPAANRPARDAWASLGFGQDMTLAARHTGPVAGPAAGAELDIRRATPDDIEVVTRFAIGLARYQAGPPMYFPYLPETEAEQRASHAELLRDPVSGCWLASCHGRPVGMQIFAPLPPTADMLAPAASVNLDEAYVEGERRGHGIGAALLQHTLARARDAGYARCTVAWLTANLSGARFWLRHGFRPLSYRLCRVLDDRVAWGHGQA